MIKTQELGDSISFAKFGVELFKQVEAQEGVSPMYQRPESPNNYSFKTFDKFKTPKLKFKDPVD